MIVFLLIFFSCCSIYYAGFILLNGYHFFTMKKIQSASGNPQPTVTIIIPARNEEKYLKNLLIDISNQSYPSEALEVIIVDDYSTDRTAAIANEFVATHPKWKRISLEKPQGKAYKKAAIQQAIQASSGEIILTTDADCRMGKEWVSEMMQAFTPEVGLVSGPVQMWSNNSWFEQFQALEFIGLIVLGAGSMHRKKPNMCNGANLAYRRSAFLAVKGFEGIDHIASGDDELLMHKIFSNTDYKVCFQKSPLAIVSTAPCISFKQFVNQRIRWVSKSSHYKNAGITRTMSIVYLSILGIPVTGIWALFDPSMVNWFFVVLGLKIFSESIVLWLGTRFFKRKSLMWLFLLEQCLHIPYVLWAGLAGNLKSYAWKDRIIQ